MTEHDKNLIETYHLNRNDVENPVHKIVLACCNRLRRVGALGNLCICGSDIGAALKVELPSMNLLNKLYIQVDYSLPSDALYVGYSDPARMLVAVKWK